jgi:large subunit ribosomal protein L21
LIGTRWAPSPIIQIAQRTRLSTSTSIPSSTLHPESISTSQSIGTADTATTLSIKSELHVSEPVTLESKSTPSPFIPRHPALKSRPPPVPKEPLVEPGLDTSLQSLLPLLRSQPPFYTTIHIHGKPYLVTEGDTIRLPFLMQGVEAGDILRFNRATIIGSRDYTLKAGTTETKLEKQKYLDERLYLVRGRVIGATMEPERTKVKKKRRQRHARYTKSQHSYTVLRITEVKVLDTQGLEGESIS